MIQKQFYYPIDGRVRFARPGPEQRPARCKRERAPLRVYLNRRVARQRPITRSHPVVIPSPNTQRFPRNPAAFTSANK